MLYIIVAIFVHHCNSYGWLNRKVRYKVHGTALPVSILDVDYHANPRLKIKYRPWIGDSQRFRNRNLKQYSKLKFVHKRFFHYSPFIKAEQSLVKTVKQRSKQQVKHVNTNYLTPSSLEHQNELETITFDSRPNRVSLTTNGIANPTFNEGDIFQTEIPQRGTKVHVVENVPKSVINYKTNDSFLLQNRHEDIYSKGQEGHLKSNSHIHISQATNIYPNSESIDKNTTKQKSTKINYSPINRDTLKSHETGILSILKNVSHEVLLQLKRGVSNETKNKHKNKTIAPSLVQPGASRRISSSYDTLYTTTEVLPRNSGENAVSNSYYDSVFHGMFFDLNDIEDKIESSPNHYKDQQGKTNNNDEKAQSELYLHSNSIKPDVKSNLDKEIIANTNLNDGNQNLNEWFEGNEQPISGFRHQNVMNTTLQTQQNNRLEDLPALELPPLEPNSNFNFDDYTEITDADLEGGYFMNDYEHGYGFFDYATVTNII